MLESRDISFRCPRVTLRSPPYPHYIGNRHYSIGTVTKIGTVQPELERKGFGIHLWRHVGEQKGRFEIFQGGLVVTRGREVSAIEPASCEIRQVVPKSRIKPRVCLEGSLLFSQM